MQSSFESPLFDSTFGRFQIKRFPAIKQENLRAWDAADEYILKQLAQDDSCEIDRPVIYNDSFGALSLALNACNPTAVSDSHISHLGIKQNFIKNNIDLDCLRLQDCRTIITCQPDLILLKVPKNHSLLEYQLGQIRKIAKPSTRIIAAGMDKYINRSMLELFDQTIGTTKTSLAWKKARLIFPQIENRSVSDFKPSKYREEEHGLTLVNYANVFSRNKLDIGARFFIKNFPKEHDCQQIIDLGCGNGILGLVALANYHQANVLFCDESYLALDSARENVIQNFGSDEMQKRVDFHIDDGLSNYQGEAADLILCNPPFHQQHSISDHIAWSMFNQAAKKLSNKGSLYVIGNRHLRYHTKLQRLFKEVKLVAANNKFVLIAASRMKT